MTSERLFNSFIHPQKLLYPPKQISGYAPDRDECFGPDFAGPKSAWFGVQKFKVAME